MPFGLKRKLPYFVFFFLSNAELIREGLESHLERVGVDFTLLRPQVGALGPSCIERLVRIFFHHLSLECSTVFCVLFLAKMTAMMAVQISIEDVDIHTSTFFRIENVRQYENPNETRINEAQ